MQFNALFHVSMNSRFQMEIYGIFRIYGPDIDCGCSLELPQWVGPNKHQQSMFWEKKKQEK